AVATRRGAHAQRRMLGTSRAKIAPWIFQPSGNSQLVAKERIVGDPDWSLHSLELAVPAGTLPDRAWARLSSAAASSASATRYGQHERVDVEGRRPAGVGG